MVWLDYWASWKLDPGAQHLILWMGICGLSAIECCLAYLRCKNQNMVDGCHANGLYRDQLDRCLAMAVLARCRLAAVVYTF